MINCGLRARSLERTVLLGECIRFLIWITPNLNGQTPIFITRNFVHQPKTRGLPFTKLYIIIKIKIKIKKSG